MKRKVLVIGKLNQLGPILNAQIIASFQRSNLVVAKDQITFLANNLSPDKIAKEAKKIGVTHTCLIGLKGHMVKSYVEPITREMASEVVFLVVATEGQSPHFNGEWNVKKYEKLDYLSMEDFSKKEDVAA